MRLYKFLLIVVAGILWLGIYNVQAQIQWSDEIFISQGNTPDLVIDRATGQLHLTAMTSNGVKYIVTDKNGIIVHQEMVPETEQDRGMWRFGASLAIDSNKLPHIGFRKYEYDNYYDVLYTYKTPTGWSTPLKIADNAYRGYVVRLAADNSDRIHFAHGSVTDLNTVIGPINYYIIRNNQIVLNQDDVLQIRGDERFEIDVSPTGIVELATGDLSYPEEGGPIYYWRSSASESSLIYQGDIHDEDARGGSNGSPDLFIDASGLVHVCYGAGIDNSVAVGPTIRYCLIDKGTKIQDTRVTDSGELNGDFKGGGFPVGVGSVAASEDGTKVVIAYLTAVDGDFLARLSEDGGRTWSEPVRLGDGWDWAEARNKHIVRAYRSNFYVIYPASNGIKLRYLKMTTNEPPVAEIGGPYTGKEGLTVQFDASASSDTDGTIVSYLWDFQNDGKWDDTTIVATNSYIYKDDFSGKINIRVIDNEGDFSQDNAAVTIANVAPTAEAGGPYSGSWGQTISFVGTATDLSPDDMLILTYEWDLDEDGIFESVGKNVQKSYDQGEKHKVWLRVKDDDEGVGLDSALVTIANEPPVVSQIPDQAIRKGETFNKISLDNYVTDPDNPDEQLVWTVSGTQHVNVIITNRIAEVKINNPDWIGSDTVLFIAKDPGDRSDTSKTIFSVTPLNQAPKVTSIPEQTILENERFTAINLDAYVNDPDNADSELSWSFSGNKALSVTITNHILQVSVPDSEWAGSETMTFKVSDPLGLKDSTSATFTVVALNDPPIVTHIPDQWILPGSSFQSIKLDDYVFDIDNQDNEIQWSVFGAVELSVQIINRVASVMAPNSEWQGSEMIIFYAKDPYGLSGSSITTFTVSTSTDVQAEHESLPTKFALYPNFPNPFNPETAIGFDIPEPSQVRITIYNRLGQKVRTLLDETKSAGRYKMNWNGTDDWGRKVSSGVYFYQLETEKFSATRKMVLIM